MNRLLLGVGNTLMGDDAAGPLLVRRLQQAPLEGWQALDGGSAPENCLYLVREAGPDEVLVVDAADMDLAPGEIRLIEAETLEDSLLMSTHTLPLSYLVQALREFVPRVVLIGIQPQWVAFGYPVSAEVKTAVDKVYDDLKQGVGHWASLSPCGERA